MSQPMTMPGEFRVAYNPVPTANRVARQGSLVRRTLVQSLLGAAVWTALVWWQKDRLPAMSWWLVAGYALALVQIGWHVVRLVLARRDLAGIGTGDALIIGVGGITGIRPGAEPVAIPWSQVGSLVGRERVGGRGPDLVITRHDGDAWSVPLSYLGVPAGTIDNAVRVFSQGRKGLDLGDLSL